MARDSNNQTTSSGLSRRALGRARHQGDEPPGKKFAGKEEEIRQLMREHNIDKRRAAQMRKERRAAVEAGRELIMPQAPAPTPEEWESATPISTTSSGLPFATYKTSPENYHVYNSIPVGDHVVTSLIFYRQQLEKLMSVADAQCFYLAPELQQLLNGLDAHTACVKVKLQQEKRKYQAPR